MSRYERSVEIAAPVERVFEFHLDTRNLVRISPGWIRVVVIGESGSYEAGTKRVRIRMWLLGLFPSTVDILFVRFEPPHALDDVQERGPFAEWRQTRRFASVDHRCCLLHDRVEYRLPLGVLGRIADRFLVRPLVRAMFSERQKRTRDLILHSLTDR